MEIRGDKLVWFGHLPGEPTPMTVAYSAVGKGLYHLQNACYIQNFDRWMLLLVLGAFTGAYPLMYFAQEFIPLNTAMFSSSAIVLAIIAVRSATIMGLRLALFGIVLPAAVILAATLLAAIHTRLQGIVITGMGMAVFIVAMLLIPRLKRG